MSKLVVEAFQPCLKPELHPILFIGGSMDGKRMPLEKWPNYFQVSPSIMRPVEALSSLRHFAINDVMPELEGYRLELVTWRHLDPLLAEKWGKDCPLAYRYEYWHFYEKV